MNNCIMDKDEAVALIEEAIEKIKKPSINSSGGRMEIGGVYWRLVRVLNKFVVPQLSEIEGREHSEYLRETFNIKDL